MSQPSERPDEVTPSTGGIATVPRQWLRQLAAGEVLFREGDTGRQVFVLLEGRVQISKEGRAVAELTVADSFIGEISALTGKPRWATATILDPSTLLVVSDIGELFRGGSAWGLKLATALAARLDRTNERFKRLQVLLDETRTRDTDPNLIATMEVELRETDDLLTGRA